MEGQEEGQQHCAKPLRESFKSYYRTMYKGHSCPFWCNYVYQCDQLGVKCPVCTPILRHWFKGALKKYIC